MDSRCEERDLTERNVRGSRFAIGRRGLRMRVRIRHSLPLHAMSSRTTFVLIASQAIWATVLLVGLVAAPAAAKIQYGSINTEEKWMFVSKFCFSNEFDHEGNVTFKITNIDPTYHKNLTLMVYYDDMNSNADGSWFKVWHNNKLSCQEKVAAARASITLYPPGGEGEFLVGDYALPHFWYLVAADCGSPKGLDFDYYIEWTNPGGGWYRQLGWDEQGIPNFYLTFFFFYLILAALHVFAIVMLRKMECYHQVIQLLTICIGIAFVSNIFYLIHWGVLANNGLGAAGIKGLADLMMFGMEVVLALLVILIAKGWAVTSTQLQRNDRLGLIVLVSVLTLSYLSLFIWDYAGREPASTAYFYESAPGYIVIIIRMATMCWFIYSLWSTLKLETLPEKRTFYIAFGSIFTIWFLTLPVVVIVAAAIPQYWRMKVVTDFQGTINFFWLAFMTVLFWPSYARKYFIITPGVGLLSKQYDPVAAAEPAL